MNNFKVHNLKIKPKFLERIIQLDKTAEVRKNDRDFQKWDVIQFIEYNEEKTMLGDINYVNDGLIAEITHVFQEIGYWLEEWYCILSLKIISKKDLEKKYQD